MKNQTDKPESSLKLKDWVELYSDYMFSWAFQKTASRETAEDLLEETFLAAVKSFNKFERKSNPKTWLLSIHNNKINDHYRNSFRKPAIFENKIIDDFFDINDSWKQDETPQEWTSHTEKLLDNTDFTKTLNNCMQSSPEKLKI